MSRFFYLQKGKSLGPIGEKEIVALLAEGKISAFDLICREGEKKWRPLAEYSELRSKLSSKLLAESGDQPWVLLVRSEGQKFHQRGPYAKNLVEKWLKNGEIKYTDYAWTSGMSKWEKLGSLKEFNPKGDFLTFEDTFPGEKITQPESVTSEELLNSVMEMQTAVTTTEIQPEVEVGENEAALYGESVVETEPSISHRKIAPNVSSRLEKVKSKEKSKRGTKPSKVKWKLQLSAVFLLLVVVIGFFVWKKTTIKLPDFSKLFAELRAVKPVPQPMPPVVVEKKNEPESESEPELEPVLSKAPPIPEPEKSVEATPPPVAVPLPPAPKEAINKEPTFVNISKKYLDEASQRLILETDASYHYPLRMKISAKIGEVLDVLRIERDVLIRWKEGGQPEFSLKELPWGNYHVEVDYKTIHAEADFFLGKSNSEFQAELKSHKKKISYGFQQERAKLFQALKDIEELSREMKKLANKKNSPWVKNTKKWQKQLTPLGTQEIKVASKMKGKETLFFPQEWKDFGDLKTQLNNQIKAGGRLLKQSKANELSDNLDKLNKDIKNMRARSASLSLW